MCGRGRNKPSWGEPHFLIASCSPFPPPFLPVTARRREPATKRQRNGTERNGTESGRDLSCHCLSALANAGCWTDCKWRQVYDTKLIVSPSHSGGAFELFPPALPRPRDIAKVPPASWIWECLGDVVTRRNFARARSQVLAVLENHDRWARRVTWLFGAVHKSWSSWSCIRTIYYHWS